MRQEIGAVGLFEVKARRQKQSIKDYKKVSIVVMGWDCKLVLRPRKKTVEKHKHDGYTLLIQKLLDYFLLLSRAALISGARVRKGSARWKN